MDISSILDSISKLLWPILAIILIWKLYPVIKKLIESRGFTIKVGDMEVTVQEASDQLRAQVEDLQEKVTELRTQIQQKATPKIPPLADKKNRHQQIKTILWVDDKPSNNAFEMAVLESLGYKIYQAVTTSEALSILFNSKFNIGAIISDMGRSEKNQFIPKAGIELIKMVRELRKDILIIIYTTSNSVVQLRNEVIQNGGNGITTSPVELFEMINSWPPK